MPKRCQGQPQPVLPTPEIVKAFMLMLPRDVYVFGVAKSRFAICRSARYHPPSLGGSWGLGGGWACLGRVLVLPPEHCCKIVHAFQRVRVLGTQHLLPQRQRLPVHL